MAEGRSTIGGLIACAAALAWTAAALANDSPIVVGFAVSTSGQMQAYSGPAANAARIAIEEINARGGLLGRQIVTIEADAKTDRSESAKAGIAVLAEGADLVIVDCDYDFGGPAALQAQNAGKISFFLCAESVLAGIQGIGGYSFSPSILASVQGATMAEWGYNKKGWRTAYILLDDLVEYNKGVCYGFDWMWRKLGGTVLGHDVFQNTEPSIQSQIDRVAALADPPDMIQMCSFVPGGASAIRQIRANGITAPIAGGSSMSGLYWLEAVPDLSNHFVPEQASIYGDDPRPAVESFNQAYEARFGSRPGSQYTYPGYVLIEVWARAVERAGTIDAASVVAQLEQMREEPVLVGTRTFTDTLHHQDRAPFLIVETADGTPRVVDSWTISEPVPFPVLFGKEYGYIAR